MDFSADKVSLGSSGVHSRAVAERIVPSVRGARKRRFGRSIFGILTKLRPTLAPSRFGLF